MKQMSLTTGVIAASTFACAALLSFGWSEQRGISLSVESAQARVGRPLSPVSVAGVARRHTRRAVYGGGYGAGVVGAGAVAAGTAAAVAATSPGWGWGGTGTGLLQWYCSGSQGGLLWWLPIRSRLPEGGTPSLRSAGLLRGRPVVRLQRVG